MASNSDDFDAKIPGPSGRVQELSWSLFDEIISPDEMTELESLLLSDTIARDTYIQCVQLHVDLTNYYAKPAASNGGSPSKTPVLGFLSDATSSLSMPTVDELQ